MKTLLQRSRAICLLLSFLNTTGYSLDKYEQNKSHLSRSPDYFWNQNKTMFVWGLEKNPQIKTGGFQTKGSAGIIPYIVYEEKIYVLLAKETWGTDKNTYCDLGGAVEVYHNPSSYPQNEISIDSFLTTLLKEGREESAYLYTFEEEEVLKTAHVFSHIYRTEDCFDGYESVFAFCKVKDLYFTEHFIHASLPHIQKLKDQNLCPWGFQEKDDYQWISLEELSTFLNNSSSTVNVFTNLLLEKIEIYFRPHFITALRSEAGLNLIASLLEEAQALTRVEETYL